MCQISIKLPNTKILSRHRYINVCMDLLFFKCLQILPTQLDVRIDDTIYTLTVIFNQNNSCILEYWLKTNSLCQTVICKDLNEKNRFNQSFKPKSVLVSPGITLCGCVLKDLIHCLLTSICHSIVGLFYYILLHWRTRHIKYFYLN